MEKEYIMQVAGTIREQLMTLTPISTLFSWNASIFVVTKKNNIGCNLKDCTQCHYIL